MPEDRLRIFGILIVGHPQLVAVELRPGAGFIERKFESNRRGLTVDFQLGIRFSVAIEIDHRRLDRLIRLGV